MGSVTSPKLAVVAMASPFLWQSSAQMSVPQPAEQKSPADTFVAAKKSAAEPTNLSEVMDELQSRLLRQADHLNSNTRGGGIFDPKRRQIWEEVSRIYREEACIYRQQGHAEQAQLALARAQYFDFTGVQAGAERVIDLVVEDTLKSVHGQAPKSQEQKHKIQREAMALIQLKDFFLENPTDRPDQVTFILKKLREDEIDIVMSPLIFIAVGQPGTDQPIDRLMGLGYSTVQETIKAMAKGKEIPDLQPSDWVLAAKNMSDERGYQVCLGTMKVLEEGVARVGSQEIQRRFQGK